MPISNLRISERDWLQVRRMAAPSFREGAAEVGAVGLLGKSVTSGQKEFLVSRILWPRTGEVTEASNRALVFDAGYIRRAHLEMRKEKLAGLLFVHTHPLADENVGFSKYDDFEEPQLVGNLREIDDGTEVASVVLGKRSQYGRVWEGAARPSPLAKLVAVGESLQEHDLGGMPSQPEPSPSELFSRGEALTGRGALARLARMTVAVIGASGTGSLVCELLARAGCRHIILVDFDVSKRVNLNRVLYMTAEDVAAARAKVDVVKRGIEALGLGCKVTPIRGSILEQDVLMQLRDADAIVGCLDKALPRELACRFAFQYLRPYVDVGSEIGGDEQGIVSLNARANLIAPGRACLLCAGVVTSRALRHESLSKAERERVIALGYSDDLVLDAPAVMDLNMHAAAWGMMLLRHILQPVLSRPLPVTISENLVTYRTVAPDSAKAANVRCPICKENRQFGRGDCGPRLGFGREVALELLD